MLARNLRTLRTKRHTAQKITQFISHFILKDLHCVMSVITLIDTSYCFVLQFSGLKT